VGLILLVKIPELLGAVSIKWEHSGEVVLIDVLPRVSHTDWISIKYIDTANRHYISCKEFYTRQLKMATTHKR
jgi:hypothetical protein